MRLGAASRAEWPCAAVSKSFRESLFSHRNYLISKYVALSLLGGIIDILREIKA
jgi:hypothetical protein